MPYAIYHMSLGFEFKRVLRFCLSLGAVLLLGFTVARADELHLKDGSVIEAEEVWEVGDAIWYRQGKIIASFAKTEVVRITKPKPAVNPSSNTSVPSVPSVPSVSRKISRIVLKGGTQIDADAVWEDADRLGYRLGKMHAFIDRSDVERVIRDVTVSERQAAPSNSSLRYTTGHGGLDQLIASSGDKYGIDPTLIYLVMREESRFNHRAVSRVGARGLMQLMPATAARLGVRNIHDPIENVDAGARYLRTLLEMFNGDVNLALAAYNAGEGAVLKYGRRIPPYRETMNYVWRINTAYRRAMAADR
ncbi:MAG: lytic transglycosylase domain-containing protein [Blastocatellia bacterium]